MLIARYPVLEPGEENRQLMFKDLNFPWLSGKGFKKQREERGHRVCHHLAPMILQLNDGEVAGMF